MAKKITAEDIAANPILQELGVKEGDNINIHLDETADDDTGGGVENPNKPPPPQQAQAADETGQ